MTTIGQLPLAASVSDSDEIAIYQNGQTLAATRAQMLAGVQTTLSMPANTLLGVLGLEPQRQCQLASGRIWRCLARRLQRRRHRL